jgi:proteasome lid subunit RPN8/RPN11
MRYQYAIDILAGDGRLLLRVPVTPDWSAALAWVRFEGIREGRLPAVTGARPGAVEPIWDGRVGEPYLAAFRAVVCTDDGAVVAREIPKIYLRDDAQQASAALVAQGKLEAGEVFRYLVSAFPVAAETGPAPLADDGLAVEEVVRPLPLVDEPIAGFFDRAVCSGPEEEAAGSMPVFVPRGILDEATALARGAGDVETGGVLVGKLHRDSGGGTAGAREIFVEVTAQVPAVHAVSRPTKLTFTAETWAAVRAAVALRRRDEQIFGWWHSHPDFCRLRGCPLERRRDCIVSSPFLSKEDVHLHAACFPQAYQVALLVSDSAATGGMTSTLFGWSQGMVAARAFHVLEGGSHATLTATGS